MSEASLTPDDDARLMVAVAAGCTDSFVRLCDRHQGPLFGFFRRMGARVQDAEDAVQETLLRLFRFRIRYEPTGRFGAFLFTLARHVWLDAVRQSRRHPVSELPESELTDLELSIGRSEDRLDARAALAQLGPDHRMVLIASLYHGLTYREIGRAMGIPEGTVKSRAFHAVRKLQAILGPEFTDQRPGVDRT